MKIWHFILVFILYSYCTSADTKEIGITCNNGLNIQGKTENKVTTFSFFDNFSFNNDMPIVFGKLLITNNTSEELEFSTKMFKTKFNNGESVRSYKQTFYSETIDFSYIKIPSESSINLDVYWSPDLIIGDSVVSIISACEKVT